MTHSTQHPVRAWKEPFVLPTYEVGPEDPSPSFHRAGFWSIYPYNMQDDLTLERKDKTYRAVFLENGYLRLIILPELGGHLYSAQDKTTGHELFYRNNVVKPGLVALRGAWISGGVEFNFPKGHTVTTVSLVDHCIRRNHRTVENARLQPVGRRPTDAGRVRERLFGPGAEGVR